MKKFLTYSIIVLAVGVLIIRNLPNIPRYTPVQALGQGGMTALPTSSPFPTNTPEPTMTPFPTVDYQATDQAYQLAEQQERNRMIEVQLQHDEAMLAQQVELARVNGTATAAGTMVALANAQSTLESGRLTAIAIQATSTHEAPEQAAQLLQVQDDAKHFQGQRIKENIAYAVAILFVLSLTVLIIRKAIVINAAYIEKVEQEARKDAEARKPVEAPVVDYVINDDPINRRMEQRFATVLLAMHALEPDDAAVNLLESFWVVRGARDKFQNRDEFLAVRDDWASDENAIIGRVDPTKANSTFRVFKWDEVQEIADGSRL